MFVQEICLYGKQKGYKKQLVSSGSMSDMDKVPTLDKHENAMEAGTDLDKKM